MKLLLCILLVGACTDEGIHTTPIDQGSGSNTTSSNANCQLPEGALHGYTQVSEFNPLAIGKWVRCSGPAIFSNEELGLEFDADGTYYFLGDDGHGGVVKRTGFGKQGTWDGSQEGNSVQWNIHPTANSGTGGYAQFEDNPRRFAMLVDYNETNSVYAIVP